jgi:hypothetical protein
MIRLLKKLEASPVPPAPEAVWRALGNRPDAKSAGKFLRWIYDQPGFVLPDGALREVPAEAPWTPREKLLIAYRGLKDAGMDVRLFWRLAYRPAPNAPACEAAAVAPVLALADPNSPKDVHYYDMEYPPRVSENAESLWGHVIYGVTPDGKLEKREVPAAGVSANRLSAVFNLRLDDAGVLSGTVKVTARRAWRALLFPPEF